MDPFGEDAKVKVDGNNVQITIPITYSGNAATPQLIESLNQSISNQWSGQFGKFTVTTTVVTGSENTVNLVSGAGTSVVANGKDGTWFVPGQGNYRWEATHEAGHLMGLPDEYDDCTVNGVRKTTPRSGFENNIMGRYGKTGVTQDDIQKIINANTSFLRRLFN